jgi:hypothetical protein
MLGLTAPGARLGLTLGLTPLGLTVGLTVGLAVGEGTRLGEGTPLGGGAAVGGAAVPVGGAAPNVPDPLGPGGFAPGGGWVTGPSTSPPVPDGRWNEAPVVGSTSVNWLITVITGVITVIDVAEKVGHDGPTNLTEVKAAGAVNGLPQKHLVTGKPCRSTSTAVPACRTAANAVTCPSTKPWLVTLVSERRMTGVSVATKAAISVCWMPSTLAKAAPLSGWASRNATSWPGSQELCFCVPPKSPTVLPGNVPPLWGGGVTFGRSVPTGGEKGLVPVEETGSN